ncbi:MAG: N-acetylmuramoyl-L-alanine amidase [Vicinamibacterales bacterium]
MRLLLTAAFVIATVAPAAAQSAQARYEAALARETQARASQPAVGLLRRVVAQYEAIVARYPRSGYSDNALWQAAHVAFFAYERHGQDVDRRTAVRLLQQLRRSYPSGTLARQVPARIAEMASAASPATGPASTLIRLTDVTRSALPAGERITIVLDTEPQYQEERITGPERLFFDFKNTEAADTARPSLERLAGGVVRDVRLGARPEQTTRLVLELEPNTRHSVFALYNPYRLVIDLERVAPSSAPPAPAPSTPPALAASVPAAPHPLRDAGAPAAPSANSNGSFSLARQLGLGVARIVIDPGHGGHDPGAMANKAREAALVLDIALRLEKLLLKQQGIDVVLTRRTDVFVPLEERTAIANREGADLFLSIHANVGRNTAANGVETFFLNFSTDPEAEAVAARENAGAGLAMHTLPDIVRKIALNNKLDESRDFAKIVQTSLYRGVRQHNAQTRNRGVKQAPFVVLIGAEMPSALAEVSFVTNRKEAALLKTAAYRQRIAQSLFDAILKYRQSLKNVATVASGAQTR